MMEVVGSVHFIGHCRNTGRPKTEKGKQEFYSLGFFYTGSPTYE